MSNNITAQLAAAIADGGVRIVDLTQTLTPQTPILQLPEQFGQSWPFRKDRDFPLRRSRPGLVLEQLLLRRAHRHALRRTHSLGDRQGLREQRH